MKAASGLETVPDPMMAMDNRYSVVQYREYVAGAVAVKERGLAVDPSDHRENTVWISRAIVDVVKLTEHTAPAIQASVTGAVYVPGAHPTPDIVNDAGAALWNVVNTANEAVTDCGAVIVTVAGLATPAIDPDQPLN